MKPTSLIPALLVAAAALSSLAAPAGAASEPPSTGEQAAKAGPTKVEPHSHLQEKTGMRPQKKAAKRKQEEKKNDAKDEAKDDAKEELKDDAKDDAGAKGGKVRADKDKTRHLHPRDAK